MDAPADGPGLVLVTGASGAVGRRLLDRLARRGRRARCLVHRRAVEGADETVAGDLGDASSLRRAASGVDAVLHLAALTHARDPRRYDEVNVAGTVRLLLAAREAGVRRFVHVSTRAISPEGGAYSASKARAEEAVAASGLPFTIVRLPDVYGAGGREGADRIVELARRGAPIPLVGRGDDEICPVYVDDALEAIVAALDADGTEGKTYTLAGRCLTIRQFADACIAAFASSSRQVPVPVPLVGALGLLGRVVPLPVYPDQLKRLRAPKPPPTPEAREELDFRPRSLEEGLAALGST